MVNLFAILTILCFFIFKTQSQGSYRVNVTYEQIVYWRRTLYYIQQFTNKRCTKASPMAQQRYCTKRCQLMFYYIPDAPYKNYRYYNYTTKDCEPKVICPQIFTVQYNSMKNKCYDMSTGDQVSGIDAKPYAGNDTYEVQFDCINGYVGMFKGRKQCICYFGWKTQYLPGLKSNPKYQKCNKGISIYDYLSQSVQIYYDTALDNPYPHPADPDYWPKILVNYLKQLKYTIITSIWPNEVQLTLLTVPTQPLIREQDKLILIWGGTVFLLIVLISIYEKVKNTRTMEQMVAGGNES